MNKFTKNNNSNYIWDSPDYPWNDDLGLDMLKVEYDKQRGIEERSERASGWLPSTHQHSSEIAGFMKNRVKKTGMPLMAQNHLSSQNSNATNNRMSSMNSPQESSVTNGDGSITITRERQINNNGTMQTQTGRIRLMPQYKSANGAPAVVDSKIKSNLFDFSEHQGGAEIEVSSGTRTKAQNKRVKGAKASQHLVGNAADIKVGNGDSSEIAADAHHSNIFNRVNIYSDGRVHVDNKPRPSNSTGFYREWQRVGDKTPRNKPTPPKKRK